MRSLHFFLEDSGRAATGQRDHGHMLLDQPIGLCIETVSLGLISELTGLDQDLVDVGEAIPKLLRSAGAKVEVHEVVLIWPVSPPTQHV